MIKSSFKGILSTLSRLRVTHTCFESNRTSLSFKFIVSDTLRQISVKRLKSNKLRSTTLEGAFCGLIFELYRKYKTGVVVLIDEYDKPILDNLDQMEVAIECREMIKSIYAQIKENDRYIKFAFLTGAEVSLSFTTRLNSCAASLLNFSSVIVVFESWVNFMDLDRYS